MCHLIRALGAFCVFLFVGAVGNACASTKSARLKEIPQAGTKQRDCKISGCNRELCVEAGEDVVSICIYQERFKCYQQATCKRQLGYCAWTQTPALTNCLKKAGVSDAEKIW